MEYYKLCYVKGNKAWFTNNLAEPFKNVAKELNKMFFGNDND